MNTEDLILLTLIVSVVMNITFLHKIDVRAAEDVMGQAECVDTAPRCVMFNNTLFSKSSYVDGIYFSDSHYCVWTKNQSSLRIEAVDYHEQCHDLVYYEYDHFCLNTTHK